ncbi:MAG: tRNA (guanosine(37)-N1)-methyltransferase TrmD [Anaerolineales bacterium]|nr:tRNA (guanosine(37)-N1)-methyltransferase TrmD [Anaerolineales bacterium]MDP2776790.1 tRNA (guanosine(37)-N1)-methyltransferase TrmD [Anaerolineales bacterium]
MQFEVFSLLPEVFPSYLETSIIKRARERGLINVRVHNIRDYTHDKHHMTDDTPFGGGGGMVMKPGPVFEAIESVLELVTPPSLPQPFDQTQDKPESNIPIILLTPQGRVFNQTIAQELSQHPRLALLCGRYEGVDERIREHLVTDEISIGDYVLTGGELPALILIDAIARILPDVLGDPTGAQDDSHAMGLLEYPHYTRPPEFRGWKAPDVLLSGDHAKIEKWRREQALLRTFNKRPDMLEKTELTKEDLKFVESLKHALSNVEGSKVERP